MKKVLFLFNTKKNRSLAKKERAKKHPRNIIVLMSMPTPIHAVTAVLDMPHDFHGRVDRASEIFKLCDGNAYVTIAAGVITAALAKLEAYSGAATAAGRAAEWPPLHNTLKSFMGLFQDAANNDIEHAIVIIESGGFKVKNMSIPQKHMFKAENGAISGHVDLYAEGGPAGSTHNWQFSTDGINYEWLRGTHHAETHYITGLSAGTKVYFIHELSIDDVAQPQSNPFPLILT